MKKVSNSVEPSTPIGYSYQKQTEGWVVYRIYPRKKEKLCVCGMKQSAIEIASELNNNIQKA